MSAKNLARRVELKLKFENVSVPADINKYLSSLTFTDEEEDNADDLQLAFDDRESKWLGSWLEVKPTFVKTSTTVQKQVEAASVVNYVVKKVIPFGLLPKSIWEAARNTRRLPVKTISRTPI